MRILRMAFVALLGLSLLSLSGVAVAQRIDDPASCPADSFCADCIRLGGVWDQDRAAAGECGGIFCCVDKSGSAPAPAPAPVTASPEPSAAAPAAPAAATPPATPVPAKPTYTG